MKSTLATLLLLFVVTTVVRVTARVVTGTAASYAEAAKSVGLSFFFLVLTLLALLSFAHGTGISEFTGLAGHLVFAAFFVAHVLSFELSLGLSFWPSAAVAVVSTVASTVFFLLFKGSV